ncbi:GntR family transcriptional regulator [Actinophytocola oryzae]|uniref:GntR family transcriptional regulator n=2 Tax=Actinophytocola oryzae TaxID=502181 RepID=A0A4R7VV49_9PSEU|nr:GntR family transcriptional regulator [Actinophytocola oryzae]
MLEEYRVGRGSLREALRILEVHGLISIKPGPRGGPTVDQVHTENFGRMATLYFQMDGVTFADLVDARVIMEPTLATLAAQRRDPQLVGELARFTNTSRTDDDEYASDVDEFHRLVAAMSGNPVMTLFGQSMTDILRDRLSPPLFPKSRRAAVLNVHTDIARAVADGDAVLAERLMREHMTEYAAYARRRHPGLMREVVDWR